MKRLFSLLSFIICAGFLLSSCKVTPPVTPTPEPTNPPVTTPTFSVGGIALDEKGSSVPNANVTLTFAKTKKQYAATTDGAGNFRINNLDDEEGAFVLKAQVTKDNITLQGSAAGGISKEASTVNLAITLYRQGVGVVKGKVTKKAGDTTTPVDNAIVTIIFSDTSYKATTSTNAQGEYILSALPTDGTFSIIAFDNTTGGNASSLNFLVSEQSEKTIDITLKVPEKVNDTPTNIDFNDGSLSGWEIEGNAKVVPLEQVFPSASASGSAQLATQEVTSSYVALIDTTKGKYGSISQSFKVPAGVNSIVGVAKFLSNEYPKYYGSKYNDGYVITVSTPLGSQVIAESNLNSSTWEKPGALGYSGKTPKIPLLIDTSAFADTGGVITITAEVSDVGDEQYDSALAFAFNTSNVSVFEEVKLQIPKTLILPVPNDFPPSSAVTPKAFDVDVYRVILARFSDIKNGYLTITVPVKTVSHATNSHTSVNAFGFIGFKNETSVPVRIQDGVAYIPVRVKIKDFTQPKTINLSEIGVALSGNNSNITQQQLSFNRFYETSCIAIAFGSKDCNGSIADANQAANIYVDHMSKRIDQGTYDISKRWDDTPAVLQTTVSFIPYLNTISDVHALLSQMHRCHITNISTAKEECYPTIYFLSIVSLVSEVAGPAAGFISGAALQIAKVSVKTTNKVFYKVIKAITNDHVSALSDAISGKTNPIKAISASHAATVSAINKLSELLGDFLSVMNAVPPSQINKVITKADDITFLDFATFANVRKQKG